MIQLNTQDKRFLLTSARTSIADQFASEKKLTSLLDRGSEKLKENGASFVTLTINGKLRGCIGTLIAYQSLVQDVCEHAIAAAFNDYRFPQLRSEEVDQIEIEISYLTPPVDLGYSQPSDLPKLLKPEVDGVILSDGFHKATFLPQVWEQLPDPIEFLNHLSTKMGLSKSAWREKHMNVKIYHVVHFSESDF